MQMFSFVYTEQTVNGHLKGSGPDEWIQCETFRETRVCAISSSASSTERADPSGCFRTVKWKIGNLVIDFTGRNLQRVNMVLDIAMLSIQDIPLRDHKETEEAKKKKKSGGNFPVFQVQCKTQK